MKHKTAVTIFLLAFCAYGALLTFGVKRPSAQAAPIAMPVATRPATLMAAGAVSDILDGKTFPSTLTPDQINAGYHLVSIVDTQGKPGTYATKGETVTLGSETFLVAYFVPLTSGIGKPAQPKADATAQLGLINMRYITVLYDIRPVGGAVTTPPAAPAKETDTP